MHGGTAHQNSIGVVDIIGMGILLGQQFGALCGNLVERMNIKHNGFLLSMRESNQPFSFSKASMKATSFSTPSMGIAL